MKIIGDFLHYMCLKLPDHLYVDLSCYILTDKRTATTNSQSCYINVYTRDKTCKYGLLLL